MNEIMFLCRLDDSCCKSGSAVIGKSEQLVLYVRALHLLSSALRIAKEALEDGSLRPSAAVKKV